MKEEDGVKGIVENLTRMRQMPSDLKQKNEEDN